MPFCSFLLRGFFSPLPCFPRVFYLHTLFLILFTFCLRPSPCMLSFPSNSEWVPNPPRSAQFPFLASFPPYRAGILPPVTPFFLCFIPQPHLPFSFVSCFPTEYIRSEVFFPPSGVHRRPYLFEPEKLPSRPQAIVVTFPRSLPYTSAISPVIVLVFTGRHSFFSPFFFFEDAFLPAPFPPQF